MKRLLFPMLAGALVACVTHHSAPQPPTHGQGAAGANFRALPRLHESCNGVACGAGMKCQTWKDAKNVTRYTCELPCDLGQCPTEPRMACNDGDIGPNNACVEAGPTPEGWR